ncbi:polysaccharide pyruvyl transferase family protein [Jiangella gansuensis]|uniref:polysaccharide pyruvyl transferase family protein n=1 Tax=Jiangella gansuensis TaxID=281473 RepID=UPI00047E955D|nr:polysaccharide pyruvyl transferase family protein [Jiangella gansuensis]
MAIWLGALASLRRLGVKVGYQCDDQDTFSMDALRRAVPDGPVLLTGGGDFGDLYTRPDGRPHLREQILAEMPGIPVIQLPQSVNFRDQIAADHTRRLIDRHGRFTMMVRDRRSHQFAQENFDADLRLTPDMAFGLDDTPQTRPSERLPHIAITWLHWFGSDAEYVDIGGPPRQLSHREIEWTRPIEAEPSWRPRQRAVRRINGKLCLTLQRHPRLRSPLAALFGSTFEPLATAALLRGLTILRSSSVVVTNRLHGHILALLAGLPHVVLDNSYGKVRGVYDAWTKPSKLARWADNGDEARRMSITLVDSVRESAKPG